MGLISDLCKTISMCCFSTEDTDLRSKNKDLVKAQALVSGKKKYTQILIIISIWVYYFYQKQVPVSQGQGLYNVCY